MNDHNRFVSHYEPTAMKLFLIRHGETVDNVAGLYAGVRDSALTVHGSLQAERLGKYLTERGLRFTHIFSSDLQRAYKTALAIRTAQVTQNDRSPLESVDVQSLMVLREQDFGFYEGKPFYARSRESKQSGKDEHRSEHQGESGFKDVESKQGMATRMDQFLQEHLISLMLQGGEGDKATLAIVSHGIILSHLWRCFLKLFPKNSVTVSPDLSVATGGSTPLEHLGGWSNTGYLELDISVHDAPILKKNLDSSDASTETARLPEAEPALLPNHKMTIKTVNGKEHLVGLKRTKGVGSSQHDESQRKIEVFFKKREV